MRIKYTALEQQWKSINGHIQQRSNYIKQYMLDADGMMPALKSSLNSLARMVAALDAGLCNKVKDWLKIKKKYFGDCNLRNSHILRSFRFES